MKYYWQKMMHKRRYYLSQDVGKALMDHALPEANRIESRYIYMRGANDAGFVLGLREGLHIWATEQEHQEARPQLLQIYEVLNREHGVIQLGGESDEGQS